MNTTINIPKSLLKTLAVLFLSTIAVMASPFYLVFKLVHWTSEKTDASNSADLALR